MMRKLGLAIAAGLCAMVATAGEMTLELREQLNRAWQHERVSWDVELPDGEAAPGTLTMSEDGKPVALQVTVLDRWPDGEMIRRARIHTVVESLEPLSTRTYKLAWTLDKRLPPPVAMDLRMAQTVETIELATERFAIRMVVGEETYDPPRAASEVPGPIAGWRLSDGTWMGGSSLYGGLQVASRQSKLITSGPIQGQMEVLYTYTDGSTLTVQIRLDAQASFAMIEATSSATRPDSGWQVLLGGAVKPSEMQAMFGQRQYAKEIPWSVAPADAPVGILCPWIGDYWFRDRVNVARLPLTDKADQLVVSVHDVGRWVEPKTDMPWFRFDQWDFPSIGEMWSGAIQASGSFQGTTDGVTLSFAHAGGTRIWSLGLTQDPDYLLSLYRRETMSGQSPMPTLEDVQRMVLDWPDGDRRHPVGMIGPEQYTATQEDVNKARGYLDKLGSFDIFRYVVDAAGHYDTVVDSELIDADTRRLFKAQMAYLAYVNADPLHWSHERGFCSGNPNMSVARITNVGKIACILYDHPMADAWYGYTEHWLDFWLANVVDADGGWPESTHYARVAVAEMALFAIMARRAGRKDYLQDPTFQRLAEFYEKTLTPPDPMRRGGRGNSFGPDGVAVRVPPPYGRGTRGGVWGLGGLWATAFAETDPALSGRMMWSWNRTSQTRQMSHGLGGQHLTYMKRDLPEITPDWRSERLASLGYLLRDRVGEPDEDYLLLVSEPYQSPDGHIWPPDTGGIAKWFHRGVPVAGNFRRIPEVTSVLTTNRVTLAANWDPAAPDDRVANGYRTTSRHDAFSTLPTGDYVSVHFSVPEIVSHHLPGPKDMPAFPKRATTGDVPLDWQRQLLVVRGTQEFIVLRDTVRSPSPTQWQFWTLSEALGTPAEVADRKAFLEAAPGAKYAPARALAGDRFVAVGKMGMDTDYYIASPSATPRHTLRFGTTGSAYGIGKFTEFQDLMLLRLEGPGTYFVALAPRKPDEPMPEFTTHGDGTVIRVRTEAATTWCFLSDEPATVTVDGIRFQGTAGVVTVAGDATTIGLAAAGEIEVAGHVVTGDGPASETFKK